MDDLGENPLFSETSIYGCFPSNVFTQKKRFPAFASKLDAGKTSHHHAKLNLQRHRISLLFGPTLVNGY